MLKNTFLYIYFSSSTYRDYIYYVLDGWWFWFFADMTEDDCLRLPRRYLRPPERRPWLRRDRYSPSGVCSSRCGQESSEIFYCFTSLLFCYIKKSFDKCSYGFMLSNWFVMWYFLFFCSATLKLLKVVVPCIYIHSFNFLQIHLAYVDSHGC